MFKNIFGSKKTTAPQESPPARMLDLLDMALDQRTKFHLVFDNEVTSIHNLSCTLLSFDATRIILELTSLRQASQRFVGEALTCYFRIVEKKPKIREVFYSFRSVVREVGKSRQDTVVFKIETPTSLGQDQRRKSLRITPDMAHFVSFDAWPFRASGGVDFNAPGISLDDFKTPQMRLANISAGGLKLVAKHARMRELDPEFAKGSRLILHVKIREQPKIAVDECWLIARAVLIYEDFVSKDVHVGMEFIAYGRLDPETNKLAWKKVQDNVVEDVSSWTHQWHLDLYREKGLAPE